MDALLIKKPLEVSFSGNPMPLQFVVTPYGINEQAQDVQLLVSVLVEDTFNSNVFKNIYNQPLLPDNNGSLYMDVQTLLDSYLENVVPDVTITDRPLEAKTQRKRYKISYQLQVNGIAGTLTTSSVLYAIKGGLAYESWNPSFFAEHIATRHQVIHYDALYEKVAIDQLVYFWWIYPLADNAEQRLECTFYLDDGTHVDLTVTNKVICGKWGVCYAPVSIYALNPTIPAGKYIIRYQVAVYSGTSTSIATMLYYIDHRKFYDTHLLLFRNSFGALESIRLRGQVEAEADYNYQQATRTSMPSYYAGSNLLPSLVQETNDETAKFTGDTGFYSKSFIDNLRDLLLSPQVFEYKHNKLYPVVLIGKNAKLYTNKNTLFSMSLQWQMAFINNFYTPSLFYTPDATCPPVEYFNVKQVNKRTLQIMWALKMPYDKVNVEITIDSTVITNTYTGNAGAVLLPIDNDLEAGETLNITCKARTQCGLDSFSSYTTKTITLTGNSLPVAVNDNYTISAGFSSAVALSGSVLANDYDPDGDDIEVVAASGTTANGGAYTIDAGGNISYTPPSSAFVGTDTFTYNMREVGGSDTVPATVTITVGAASTLYVRLVQTVTSTDTSGGHTIVYGQYTLKFYSNSAGTTLVDTTGSGININLRDNEVVMGSLTQTTYSVVATGFSKVIYSGQLSNFNNTTHESEYEISIDVLAGSYTVIP